MLTYGFYNSVEGDRKYDAVQLSSIFDGIIEDGVFANVGEKFLISATDPESMEILVGTGRAWFDHTWTLNDSRMPLAVEQSEAVMNRIDTVVLEVNESINVRENKIFILKGDPSSQPQAKALTNDFEIHQYVLAYITVNRGVTSIRQSDIQMIAGTEATPYVTAPLDKMSFDTQIAQFAGEWNEFYSDRVADADAVVNYWNEQLTTTKANYDTDWEAWRDLKENEMINTQSSWSDSWSQFSTESTARINNNFAEWNSVWDSYYNQVVNDVNTDKTAFNTLYNNNVADMTASTNSYKNLWDSWYQTYTSDSNAAITNMQNDLQTQFDTWFNSLQTSLDGTTATSLANSIAALDTRVDSLEEQNSSIVYGDEIQFASLVQDMINENLKDSQGNNIASVVLYTNKEG